MKKALYIALLTTCAAFPAQAQPIESEPLPAPYTLQNETDPMALDSAGSTAPVAPEAEIAPPPPGANTIKSSEPPAEASQPAPSDSGYPPILDETGPKNEPIEPSSAYPNNNVSGVPIQNTDKFEKMVFCTLKISVTSMGSGIDKKSDGQIKTYIESQADKLTYMRKDWGKEGEHDYCITIPDHKNRAVVYKELKKIVAAASPRAPVTMTGEGFAPVKSNKKTRE